MSSLGWRRARAIGLASCDLVASALLVACTRESEPLDDVEESGAGAAPSASATNGGGGETSTGGAGGQAIRPNHFHCDITPGSDFLE